MPFNQTKIIILQEIAFRRGGRLLSKKYAGAKENLLWMCANGHKWKAHPNNIKSGTWCPTCGKVQSANSRKDTIENMLEIAQEKNGTCLSKKYIDSKTNLKWKCAKGHIWNAAPGGIINGGTWCPTCSIESNASKQRSTISDMNSLAKSRGGKCISKEYINSQSPLEWKCSNGHIWEARPSNINFGGWCPYCSGHKYWGDPLKELAIIAKKNGGELLSKKHFGSAKNLIWRCSKGHKWKAKPANIQSGTWCPFCYGNVRKTLADAREAAEVKGGACLSRSYKNAKAKLKWRCAEGHVWSASWESAIQYSWCPQCNASSSFGERAFRDIFQQVFKTSFPRKRPKWLTTKDGKRLELDGYSEKLQIAFEYHGPQHEFEVPYFHSDAKSLGMRKHYDEQKRMLCLKNNIKLVELPYTKSFSDMEHLKRLFKARCKQSRIKLPKNFISTVLTLNGPFKASRLNQFKEICRKKEGILLSNSYLGANSRLEIKCKSGHIWKALPGNISQGYWCPYCANRKTWKPLETYQKLARIRKGQLLSKTYSSSNEKLEWKCKFGHIWKATPGHIRSGTWCPFCSKVRIWGDPLVILRNVAKKRGGILLSNQYRNAHAKLSWKCHSGHEWLATGDKIKRGSWCPKCYKENRGKK